MGSTVARGRLTDRVPSRGEDFHNLAQVGGARIEHIVSSATADPAEQVQAWDEWVLVMSGGARLELSGALIDLGPMEWVLIPAGTVHRVVAAANGTQWITVHGALPVGLGEEPRR
jgi:cupin 2 domain-containing protein